MMNKPSGKTGTAGRFDAALLSFLLISVFIISLTVRFKVLTGYLSYDLEWPIIESYNLFTHYKLILLMVSVTAAALLFLYRILKYKTGIRKDYVLISTVVLIAAALVSTFFNPIGMSQVWGFYTRTNGLLAYVFLFGLLYIVSNLRVDGASIMWLVHGVNLFSILIAGIGCFQFAGLDIFRTEWYRVVYLPAAYRDATMNSDLFRYSASSLFPHFNYYGAYCSILFPLIFAFAVKSKSRLNRILFSAGSVALFAGVLTSVSLGPFITVCIVLLLLPVAFLDRNTAVLFAILYTICGGLIGVIFGCFDIITYEEMVSYVSGQLTAARFSALAGAGLFAFGVFVFIKKCLIRHKQILLKSAVIALVLIGTSGFVYFLNHRAEDHKHLFTDRGYAWFHTAQLIKEHYLIGYGPDNLYYAFPHDQPDAELFSGGQIFDKPHNMYLQTACDTGLFGLAGFIYLLVMYLLALIKSEAVETEPVKKIYMRASILVVAAYIAQGMVNDNHLSIQPILYTVMGVGMAISSSAVCSRRR